MPLTVFHHLNYCRPLLRDPLHTVAFTAWRHDRDWQSLIDERKVLDVPIHSDIEMFTNVLRTLAKPVYETMGMNIIIDEPEPQWLRDNAGLLEALKARASFNIYVVTTSAETEQALLG